MRAVNVAAFAAGIGALVVALLSPLDALSDVLFSAHMGQHELLMLVAAPLLVMGKPWLTGGLGPAGALAAGRAGAAAAPAVRRPWRTITGPVTILVLHALALWIWHVPRLFEGALRNETVHAFQHLCFFVTAALFWWALVQGRYGRAGYGAGVLFVFITGMHSGILGALITFAGPLVSDLRRAHARGGRRSAAGPAARRPAHVDPRRRHPDGAGLALLAAWLGESERRARQADAALAGGDR